MHHRGDSARDCNILAGLATRHHSSASFASSQDTFVNRNNVSMRSSEDSNPADSRRPAMWFAPVPNLREKSENSQKQSTYGNGFVGGRWYSQYKWMRVWRIVRERSINGKKEKEPPTGTKLFAIAEATKNKVGHLVSGVLAATAIRPSGTNEAVAPSFTPEDTGDPSISRPWNVKHTLHITRDLADLPPTWGRQLDIPPVVPLEDAESIHSETGIADEPSLPAVKRLRSWGVRANADETHLRYLEQVMQGGHRAHSRVNRTP